MSADEFGGPTNSKPHHSDDIIYWGLGNDSVHGGAGDDAISGAEALPTFFARPVNPGNVLGYNAGPREFRDYDEFNPLKRIDGYFLNFDKTEGTVVTLSGFSNVN